MIRVRSPILRAFFALILLLQMSACCIIWWRTAVLIPTLDVELRDASGQPLTQATLYLSLYSHPHSFYHGRLELSPDARGHVAVSEKREFERIALMIHGIPAYYIEICVEAPGYAIATHRISGYNQIKQSEPPIQELTITLQTPENEQDEQKCPAPPSSEEGDVELKI